MGIFICGCGRNFKRGFVNVPEKYIYVEQNLSKKISVLENAGSTKAAALMQMIIEEIQLRQANYRYTVSTLAFNLVLFFDRLDNENIKFQNNSRETSDYTRKIISYIEIIYVFLTIFLYLLKCPQSLILSALRAFCFCGKPHISRSIFLYFRYQAWLKSW